LGGGQKNYLKVTAGNVSYYWSFKELDVVSEMRLSVISDLTGIALTRTVMAILQNSCYLLTWRSIWQWILTTFLVS